MKLSTLMSLLAACVLAGSIAPGAWASTENELKERFKQRYPAIQAMKDAQKIGEVHSGYIEVLDKAHLDDPVNPSQDNSPTIGQLIASENADRNELYKKLADQTGADPETVAKRNAAREFEKAKPDHYLKPANRGWVKKKDLGGQ